jgi:peptidoglycan hydrolase-like protein with peptidoglycan-binding domain
MSAASFANLPMQVGSVALAHAGRAALWVIARYMRSPLTNTAISALVITTAMAGSNALFGQQHAHPSPLFTPYAASQVAEIEPVIPATRPKGLGVESAPAVVANEAPVRVDTTPGPIGNAEVFEVQRKLEMLKLFTGTIDGYYGPQTARAIKKFEELQGLKPVGELTKSVIERIKNAPLSAGDTVPEPAAVTLPQVEAPQLEIEPPVAKPVAEAPAAAETVKPQQLAMLAEPAPLSADLTVNAPKRTTRPLPDSPEAALEMAANTAGEAIDTIISGVQTVAMNNPGKPAPVSEAAPDKPQVGVPLQINDEPAKPGTQVAVLDTPATPKQVAPISVTDPVVVAKVQRALASLGFLHGPADGVAGEATAKAIRNFEVYFNYKVTGRITPELLDLLTENGAVI